MDQLLIERNEKNMKKITAIMLVFAFLLLIVSGCGASEATVSYQNSNVTATEADTETTPSVEGSEPKPVEITSGDEISSIEEGFDEASQIESEWPEKAYLTVDSVSYTHLMPLVWQ